MLLLLLFLIIFTRLGFWQLQRADEKSQLIDAYQTRATGQAIPLADAQAKGEILRYQAVSVSGHYDNAHQFLLDNKMHQGKVGYQVITPLIPVDGGDVVLINRGWIPANQDRRILPEIKPVQGLQSFSGIVYIPLAKQMLLKEESTTDIHWPYRMQAIDFVIFTKLLQRPVDPFIIWMDPKAQAGFVRDWQLAYLKPEKHVGYALQWFSFAAVLIIIFLLLSSRRRTTTRTLDE